MEDELDCLASDLCLDEEDELAAAMKPVNMPLPRPRNPKPAHPIATDRAPTPEELLDPETPSMEGASGEQLADSTSDIVELLFRDVLIDKLETIGAQLRRKAPPAPPSVAELIIGMIVEHIASATVGKLGAIASEKLHALFALKEAEHPPGSTSSQHTQAAPATKPVPPPQRRRWKRRKRRRGKPRNTSATATARPAPPAAPTTIDAAHGAGKSSGGHAGHGKKLGEWVKDRVVGEKPEPAETYVGTTTGKPDLVGEFLGRTRLGLLAKMQDARDTLRRLHLHAAGMTNDLAALNATLRSLIADEAFNGWFVHKVTIEWMNLCARLSLGERQPGQFTDMPGANTVGGIREGGAAATKAWYGGHEGFVDITVDVRGTAPRMVSALVDGGPGVLQLVQRASADRDASGRNFTLATLPVYRRIYIKTGASKLEESVAFVITPEGAIETNLDDVALASVAGGGRDDAWQVDAPASPADQSALTHVRRAMNAVLAMNGAKRVVAMLEQHSSTELE